MNVTRPSLSISIVTYNTDPMQLESALVSIAGSTVAAHVVIADNSKNDSLQSLARKYNATYLHTGKNLGFGCAHNLALENIAYSSTYHLILNADVSFSPSVLQSLCDFLDMNPEIGWVMPNVLYPDGSRQELCKRLPTPWDLFSRRFFGNRFFVQNQNHFRCQDIDLSRPCVIPNLSGCFAFMRTDLLKQVRGFDERFFLYLEDTDLVRRIGEIALTVYYPSVQVFHVRGRGSYRNLRLLLYHSISAVKYFSKWGWFSDPDRSRRNRLAGSHPWNFTVSLT